MRFPGYASFPQLQRGIFILLAGFALAICLLVCTGISASAQGLSTGDGSWIWENPWPQGDTLTSVWAADNQNVWAVSESGAIIKWDGIRWIAQNTGTTARLYGVWGIDANNVWAVGWGGTILKWDGDSWRAQASGTAKDLWTI